MSRRRLSAPSRFNADLHAQWRPLIVRLEHEGAPGGSVSRLCEPGGREIQSVLICLNK